MDMAVNVKPLADRVLIKPAEAEEKNKIRYYYT